MSSEAAATSTIKHIERISVMYYHTAYLAPSTYEVKLKHGWLMFGNNKDFYNFTQIPQPRLGCLSILDLETREFVPMLTTGGVRGDSTENPYIIIRRRDLVDAECLLLEPCINTLLHAREIARHMINKAAPTVNPATSDRLPIRDGSETEIDEAAGSDGASPQAVADSTMIIYDDSDDDPDYEPGQSSNEDGIDGNSDMGSITEEDSDEESEEEAVETDVEEEAEVVIDLTWMSDD